MDGTVVDEQRSGGRLAPFSPTMDTLLPCACAVRPALTHLPTCRACAAPCVTPCVAPLLRRALPLQNVTVSAIITYILVVATEWVRSSFGESNLSHKTMVDRHFLI